MSSSRTARWQGLPTLAWIALIAALTGAGILIEGLSPRAAWAQVEVFVTNYLGDSVTTYSRTARGFLAPLRVISGPATQLLGPTGLAVDTVNKEILVANISSSTITVYSLTANGNEAPLRTISGPATGLAQPIGLAVVNDEVLVANESSITVYKRTLGGPPGSASANVTPLRTISGPSTGLLDPFGLVVVGDELMVANFGAVPGPGHPADPGLITVYKRTLGGPAGSPSANVTPLRTISGPATGLQHPKGLAVDAVHNEVLIVNSGSDTDGQPVPPTITVYKRTLGGPAGSPNANVTPLRTISGAGTRLQAPSGLAMDTMNDEVLVANFGANPGLITVYKRTLGGPAGSPSADVTPLRVIEGIPTKLNGPAYLAVAATCPSVFDFDFSDFNFSNGAYTRCFRDLVKGDQINAGPDLGDGSYTSLNIKGSSGTTPTTWLTVYDATPTTPAVGPTFGAQTLCADVLTVPFNNIKGAGVVALLNEGVGKSGLALVIYEAGNTDTLVLAAVDGDPVRKGKLTTLASVSLQGGISGKSWYRLIMTVDPATTPITVTGKVFRHSTPADPNSALTQVGATLTYQEALPDGVTITSPGESGILASSINAVLNVSVTNFSNNATLCATEIVAATP